MTFINRSCFRCSKPAVIQPVKCTMSDKSTKTDDVLLNGCDRENVPTTTNAATMTTTVVSRRRAGKGKNARRPGLQVLPTEVAPRPAGTATTQSAFHRQDSKGGGPQPVPAPSPPLSVSYLHTFLLSLWDWCLYLFEEMNHCDCVN